MIRFIFTTTAAVLVAWLIGYCVGWWRGYDRAEYREHQRRERGI